MAITNAEQKKLSLSVQRARKNRFIAIAVGIISLICVFYVGVKYLQKETINDQSKTGNICSDDVLREAVNNLSPDKFADAKKSIDKIIAIDGYEKDPNCLIVVANYYVMTQDLSNIKTYYGKLSAVYDESTQLSPLVTSKLQGVSYIKTNIDVLQQLEDQRKSGKTTGGWNARP